MNQYRAYALGELPNLNLRSTRDEALQDTVIRLQEGAPEGAALPVIIIETVRPAKLGDFFTMRHILGDLREAMAEGIGNDDALSDMVKIDALIEAAEGPIKHALDAAAEHVGLRIDGMIVLRGEKVDLDGQG